MGGMCFIEVMGAMMSSMMVVLFREWCRCGQGFLGILHRAADMWVCALTILPYLPSVRYIRPLAESFLPSVWCL